MNIKNASPIELLEMGVLDVLNQTLTEFTLEEHRYGLYGEVENLTTYSPVRQDFRSYSDMKIRYLIKGVTRNSFTGLINIQYLDLASCKIETIRGRF